LSRSLSRLQALVLGLVVMAGIGLAAVGIFTVGSRGWYGQDSLHIRAGFASVRGVEVGTRVRVQGMDAGEVVALLPPERPGGLVVLRMRLRGEFRPLVRTDSAAQIVSEGIIGGKVIEILPAKTSGDTATSGETVSEDALLASAPSAELGDVLGEVSSTLAGIRGGEGTLGKLARDPQAYEALLALLKQSTDTMSSVQRDADAIKRLPVVGKYVEDATELLVRPHCERNRRWFAEADIFEPGRAALTAQGRALLDDLGPWLDGMKHKGSEVVVVSYSDPRTAPSPAVARTLTRQQSESVCDYLKTQLAAQKMGWFSSRKVTPLGMGVLPPPEPEAEPLPPARVEVLVFVPQE
jgi:phospholipid/cholesterol/gamma-HCH transport system substrate-binding protein